MSGVTSGTGREYNSHTLNSIRQYESHIGIQMVGCMVPGSASRMPGLGQSKGWAFRK